MRTKSKTLISIIIVLLIHAVIIVKANAQSIKGFYLKPEIDNPTYLELSIMAETLYKTRGRTFKDNDLTFNISITSTSTIIKIDKSTIIVRPSEITLVSDEKLITLWKLMQQAHLETVSRND